MHGFYKLFVSLDRMRNGTMSVSYLNNSLPGDKTFQIQERLICRYHAEGLVIADTKGSGKLKRMIYVTLKEMPLNHYYQLTIVIFPSVGVKK